MPLKYAKSSIVNLPMRWVFALGFLGIGLGGCTPIQSPLPEEEVKRESTTYALDLKEAHFTEPEFLGSILQDLNAPLLLGVEQENGTIVEMVGAFVDPESDPAVQQPCQPTIPFFGGALIGRMGTDTDSLEDVLLSGTFDTRPLVPILSEDGRPSGAEDAICVLMSSLNVDCFECPDGTGEFCLDLLANSITGTVIDDSITPIQDPCLLEECAQEPFCE